MNLYEVLNKLEINYKEISHEKVMTVEEAKHIENMIEGIGGKNLFLTNKKGKYVLVLMDEDKKANIKDISKLVGISHLSFAHKEDLMNVLGLEEGSVTPLGIINDKDNLALIIIDEYLKDKKILVHPNTNTKTMSLQYNDLIKYIEYLNHEYLIVNL